MAFIEYGKEISADTVAALQRMDNATWEELFPVIQQVLQTYVSNKMRGYSPQLVEDVVDRTIESVVGNISRYDPEKGALEAWIFYIAGNLVKNEYRETGWDREAISFDGFDIDTDINAIGEVLDPIDPELEEEMDRRLMFDLIAQAFPKLLPQEREVLILRFGGLSSADTGKLMNRTERAIKTLRHRALHRLRTLVSDQKQHPRNGTVSSE